MIDYAAFERAMDEEKLFLDLDFNGICRRIGADRDTLDEKLFEELGLDGDSLVDIYRSLF